MGKGIEFLLHSSFLSCCKFLSEHVKFRLGNWLAALAMINAGNKTAAKTAGAAVLHLKETLIAVGLAVGTAHRVEHGRAELQAFDEVETREAVLDGDFEDVATAVLGFHFADISVHLVI